MLLPDRIYGWNIVKPMDWPMHYKMARMTHPITLNIVKREIKKFISFSRFWIVRRLFQVAFIKIGKSLKESWQISASRISWNPRRKRQCRRHQQITANILKSKETNNSPIIVKPFLQCPKYWKYLKDLKTSKRKVQIVLKNQTLISRYNSSVKSFKMELTRFFFFKLALI